MKLKAIPANFPRPSVAQAPPHQPDADLIGAAEEDLPFLGQWPWLQGRTLESVLGSLDAMELVTSRLRFFSGSLEVSNNALTPMNNNE